MSLEHAAAVSAATDVEPNPGCRLPYGAPVEFSAHKRKTAVHALACLSSCIYEGVAQEPHTCEIAGGRSVLEPLNYTA